MSIKITIKFNILNQLSKSLIGFASFPDERVACSFVYRLGMPRAWTKGRVGQEHQTYIKQAIDKLVARSRAGHVEIRTGVDYTTVLDSQGELFDTENEKILDEIKQGYSHLHLSPQNMGALKAKNAALLDEIKHKAGLLRVAASMGLTHVKKDWDIDRIRAAINES